MVAEEHGRIVCPARVEHLHLLDQVARTLLLPRRGMLGCPLAVLDQGVAFQRVVGYLILFQGLVIVSHAHQIAGQAQMGVAVVLFIAYHVAVSSHCAGRRTDMVVALGQLVGNLTPARALLGRGLAVAHLIFSRSVIIFAYGHQLVALLHVPLCSAGEQQGT